MVRHFARLSSDPPADQRNAANRHCRKTPHGHGIDATQRIDGTPAIRERCKPHDAKTARSGVTRRRKHGAYDHRVRASEHGRRVMCRRRDKPPRMPCLDRGHARRVLLRHMQAVGAHTHGKPFIVRNQQLHTARQSNPAKLPCQSLARPPIAVPHDHGRAAGQGGYGLRPIDIPRVIRHQDKRRQPAPMPRIEPRRRPCKLPARFAE